MFSDHAETTVPNRPISEIIQPYQSILISFVGQGWVEGLKGGGRSHRAVWSDSVACICGRHRWEACFVALPTAVLGSVGRRRSVRFSIIPMHTGAPPCAATGLHLATAAMQRSSIAHDDVFSRVYRHAGVFLDCLRSTRVNWTCGCTHGAV